MTKVCIDTNVWASGIVFTGAPKLIVDAALARKFDTVCSGFILNELESVLVRKFQITTKSFRRIRFRIEQVADLYNPPGQVNIVPGKHPDNLVLETALLGKADFIVTGDKQHLLPLKRFKHIKIVSPTALLDYLNLES